MAYIRITDGDADGVGPAYAPMDDPKLSLAVAEIEETYGDKVYIKPKSLVKFGEHLTLGSSSFETIWNRGGSGSVLAADETYQTTNTIAYASSDDDSDNGEVTYEYHTIDGSGNLTFGIGTVTLDGNVKTAISVPCGRISRAYNNTDTDFAGNIYFYQDDTVSSGVPQTPAKVHLCIPAGKQQSFKAATSISSVDYGIVSLFYGDVQEKTSAICRLELEVRLHGKVFRQRIARVTSQAHSIDHNFKSFLIVPPNSDVRIRGIASTTNVAVQAGLDIYLAIKQSVYGG